ncbi:hypothetical protein B0A55_12481 [Friedmanniomyces simplex]|uniref:Zn(2)-C6 fungal-type domain-containing protein n=1 Tax=Friedmanniomyces simplex TaxID=329884 RepID=A0A4U0WFX2_9PEZI|nr:hypothetical protein B0A55_12481 [Friedmanniomyces simplex]
MARISFGSRAGGASDYLANDISAYRQSNVNGVYASLQELTDALKREVQECTQSELPELTTCELSIQEDATLPLLRPAIGPYSDTGEHDLPAKYKTVWTDGTEGFPARSFPHDCKALEATDGFKYSFNNAWAAKDEGGLRFSYICQDSMQNKDRHANGFTKTQKHLKTPGEGERGPRKPTYDCKGSMSVKFSSTRRRADVYYRHYAIHSAVADRRPPLRPVPDQRSAFANAEAMMAPSSRPEASSTSKSLKRKRASEVPAPRRDPNKPLSLVELLQQSERAKSPTETEKVEVKPTAKNALPPPIDYNLPSWQAPPPPPLGRIAARLANDKGPTPYGGISAQVAPVAIPRVQSGYQTKPTPQAYQSLPQGKQHPKAQDLFSTPKAVRKEEYAGYEPHFVVFNANRAKTSCYSCRISKKKCDEGKPICGACARTGKVECTYESAPNAPARAPRCGSNYAAQQPQQGTPNAQSAHATMAPAQQTPGAGQSVGSTQLSYRTAASVMATYPMGSTSTQGYGTAAVRL